MQRTLGRKAEGGSVEEVGARLRLRAGQKGLCRGGEQEFLTEAGGYAVAPSGAESDSLWDLKQVQHASGLNEGWGAAQEEAGERGGPGYSAEVLDFMSWKSFEQARSI